MLAIVFNSPGRIETRQLSDPALEHPADAVIDVSLAALSGTDRHFINDPAAGLLPGTVIGREAVGVVNEVGEQVRNLVPGDRVVVCPAIACGNCVYCRAGYHAQCDGTWPGRQHTGPALLGAPPALGGLPGVCADKVRIPYANVSLIRLPDEITDTEAVLLADIWSSAWFAAHLAEISSGDTVAVFGCGPVGLAAIACAQLLGASRVIAVDRHTERLHQARAMGAEIIHAGEEAPADTVLALTGGIGVDRAIDAAGGTLRHSDEPDILDTAVAALAKAGTLALTGVYSPRRHHFPLSEAIAKNLTINAGFCHYRLYIPQVIELALAGRIDVCAIDLHVEPLGNAAGAYQCLDNHSVPWGKLGFRPAPATMPSEEEQLDDALADSFPASDPPSMAQPGEE